ncbi:MAG: RluA family pseudouridine synthase [Kiritimatiellae bacterium]|nr:RluA family pseudouridine synthase [Kiritimatiellia bacterium]
MIPEKWVVMSVKSPAVVSFVVSKVEAGQSLQVFLALKMALSKRVAKTLLDNRVVWVNRKCVWMTHHTVRQGDTIEVQTAHVPKGEAAGTVAKAKVRVLIEDEHYMVVDKPSGMLAVGAGSVEDVLREQAQLPSLVAVHRLDRDTTGCLLVAKSAAAFDAAVAVFKTRRVSKIYEAIVYGRFDRPASTVDQEIDGERAVSHIQREAISKDASFLKVKIETGRTHQIRRHLAALRHPVLGDREHGVKFARDPRLLTVPRQMLHASGLELPHPMVPGKTLKAHSPLPADFRRCLKLFGMGR